MEAKLIATKSGLRPEKPKVEIPDALIYEIIDGQPIHYKGYREVMSGKKTFEEIMGSSTLQAHIVTYLIMLLGRNLDEEKYHVLASEAGMHLNNRNNLAGDVLVFENSVLPYEALDVHYAQVPPKVAIEVDISADPHDMAADAYIFKKTQKLLDFGVEKVIWITTEARKVTVATTDADWHTSDWHKDIEILEGITFNIGAQLLKIKSPYA